MQLYEYQMSRSLTLVQVTQIQYFHIHSVVTICTQTGTCDTRSGDLVFVSAAFDEFSAITKI